MFTHKLCECASTLLLTYKAKITDHVILNLAPIENSGYVS